MLEEVNAISDRALFVPRWVRWLGLIFIVLLLFCSLAILFLGAYEMRHPDWIAPALSVLQLSGLAAFVMLIVFFVDRGQNKQTIGSLIDQFLVADIPMNLEKIEHKQGNFHAWQKGKTPYTRMTTKTKLKVSHDLGTNTAYYLVEALGKTTVIQTQASIKRFNIVLYLPMTNETPRLSAVEIFAAFEDTISGAKDAGYHIGTAAETIAASNYLPPGFPWPDCYTLALHLNKKDGYLYNTSEREHIAQDMAIMVAAFIHEGTRKGRM